MRRLTLTEVQKIHAEATRVAPQGGNDWMDQFDKIAADMGYIFEPGVCDCENTRFGHTPECGLRVKS